MVPGPRRPPRGRSVPTTSRRGGRARSRRRTRRAFYRRSSNFWRHRGATACLERALAWFDGPGITVERIMTDNGAAYKNHLFRDALASHAIRHERTRPYTPRTNGKAERFIQISLREWLYASPYASSHEHIAAMAPWLRA